MPPLALPDPPLSDGSIALRGFEGDDVEALVAALQDPEIPRWTLVPSPYGVADARAYIRYVNAGRAAGTRLALAIIAAGEPRSLLGSVALNPIDWRQGAADVGYWLAAGARGRGAATRAVELLARWSLETLGLRRLELRAQEDNHASRAVAARAGFTPVAAPLIRRPECDHLPDVYFARERG